MKDRSEGSMIKTYLIMWARITASKSVRPKTHVLDNEASEAFKKEIRKNCKIRLVPPDNHRRNLAERAIQTFKNHFKSVIAGVDESFPMRLWDKILPQVFLTLNLLRQLNVAPSKRVWSTSTRSRNKDQRHQHNPFHSKESCPLRMGKRCDIWEFQL